MPADPRRRSEAIEWLFAALDGLAGHPACRGYVARAESRPAFMKAHADQKAHIAAAD